MNIREGQLLLGKYRAERVLGRGGMGLVVAAHHLELDEPVALKFLLPEALQSAETIARFEREARAAVKIRSEHVARVFDVGRLETGEPYMVMELLRGLDLGQLLEQRGPLPVQDVVDYVLQAGEAIAEAHQLGIVHRDLKPQNLFLTHRADGSPCVKVLDFGISKMSARGSGDQAVTATMAILGSPLYMSPEQLMSARDIDSRTDIWALGVICFQLLTGKTPFSAATLPQLCMAINMSEPLALRSLLASAPAALEAAISRCLEKDRNLRLANLAELARALAPFGPPRSQLSVERIERLARVSAPSAPPGAAQAPPPTATRVSASTLAEPTLAESAPVESTLAEPARALGPPEQGIAGGEPRTMGEFGRTKSPPRPKRRIGLFALLALLVVVGVAATLGLAAAHRARTLAAASSIAVAPSETPPPKVAVAAPEPAAIPPPVESHTAPLPSASVAPPKPTPVATHPPNVTSAVAPPRPPALPAPKVDCDIPYSYDAKGNKIFKKACL
ncbi:MAG TPA: serine/threonine-protein kinase [Polyangiaceae bacterium]|nr:serine/threonine-protein kinase [Polyangiaceae bacterium]